MIGSLSCVFVGVLCITYAYFFDPSFFGVVALFLLYFAFTPKVFVMALSDDLKGKLASGKTYCVYDRKFWTSICVGVFAAVIGGVMYFRMIERDAVSMAIAILGMAAIFTAFVKPKVLHDGKTEEPHEFG